MKATESLRSALKISYDWNRVLAEELRVAPLTFPTPHGGNHATWVVGHLAHSKAGLLSMITGKPSDFFNEWTAKLGGGSQPQADGNAYPAYESLLRTWQQEHDRVLDTLNPMQDADLDHPPPSVPAGLKDDPSFATVGQVFLFIAMHEMSHRGQLADARRAAGLGVPAM